MAETLVPIGAYARRRASPIARIVVWVPIALLGSIVMADLAFFAVRAAHLLTYPYPLDYGEGPLLAQTSLLLRGVPVWRLYADPAAPPYVVVNYPPVYHLLAALMALPLGSALLAGRLVSLVATLATVGALWALAYPTAGAARAEDREPRTENREPRAGGRGARGGERGASRPGAFGLADVWAVVAGGLVVLAFLGLPIVREWAAVMRVDLLGVCLGLWGLVVVQRHAGERRVLWAALPLVLSVFVKPSLIAAPAAGLVWLLFRDWRRAVMLGGVIGAAGGLMFALLQAASGGWFAVHIFAANINQWQPQLAYAFWHDQLVILWPLVAAALLGFLVHRWRAGSERVGGREAKLAEQEMGEGRREAGDPGWVDRSRGERVSVVCDARCRALLPLYYTLFGAVSAYGVGKVGAYANYFLEFYAGLIWLAASAAAHGASSLRSEGAGADDGPGAAWSNRWAPRLAFQRRSQSFGLRPLAGARAQEGAGQAPDSSRIADRRSSIVRKVRPHGLVVLVVVGALLRYYPLWSETYLKPYGMIEQANPPRIAFGRYGVWRDLARERAILDVLGRVNAALADEVRAAGAPIFTDVPGVAAQAGQLARHQAFEHRQLLDAGLWDQRPLLHDLANGAVPLVILDYLGNWLTPEMVTLISHRYAQAGSRGTYDLYRPVDPGPRMATDLAFPGGLRLEGYHLAPSPGRPAYHGGETVLLTLDWRRAPQSTARMDYAVVAQVRDAQGELVAESVQPLLYGALPPADWPAGTVQHIQPIELPFDLPPGSYWIDITLRVDRRNLAARQALAPIVVEDPAGQMLGEQGYYVPAPLFAAWERAGGYAGYGDPLMPAVPFQEYTLQCFVRACLRLEGGVVQRLPLGALVYLGDDRLAPAPLAAGTAQRFAETGQVLRGAFLEYWRANGGEAAFGPPISAECVRGDTIVQYTRYARLERPIGGGEVRLGRLGEEFLRLPGGVPYRWP